MSASTPKQCLEIVGRLFRNDMRTATRETVDANYRTNAARCGERFDPRTLDSLNLSSAISLYQIGHLDLRFFQALDRQLGWARTDRARSTALVRAVGTIADSHDFTDTPNWIERAEYYVHQLEILPNVRLQDIILAHSVFSEVYAVGDPRWVKHFNRITHAVQKMPVKLRATDGGRRATCLASQLDAQRLAAEGNFVGASRAMDHCLALWKSVRMPKGTLDTWQKSRNQFAFVGQPVPAALHAPYWINMATGITEVDLHKPVTLVEFTWTGCPECHKGYPTLRRLYRAYRDWGFQALFMTYLFGNTPQHDTATVEAELAYDTYFWHHDKPIPFPIGVLPQPDATEQAIGPYPALFKQYAVIGAPTYFVIDRHGIVRYVQSGHSRDLEKRLTAIIEQLLKEAGVTTTTAHL